MYSERGSVITIDGKEFEMILTTKATKEISKRYGGIQNLGDKLSEDNVELALDEITWLIMTLVNQSISIHNAFNPQDKKALLTEEIIDLLTSPIELASYKDAIKDAIYKGVRRHVVSEEPIGDAEQKNA